MIRILVNGWGGWPTVSAAIARSSTAMTIPVTASRNVRLASFPAAWDSMTFGSLIASSGEQTSRKITAAMSNAAIAVSGGVPNSLLAGTMAAAPAARNRRKRHGAIMLPMVRGFSMAVQIIAPLLRVQ